MALEIVLKHNRPSYKSDIWSMGGGTIVELYTGVDFWDISKAEDLYKFLEAKMKKKTQPDGTRALAALHMNMDDVFSYRTGSRPSAKDLHMKFK